MNVAVPADLANRRVEVKVCQESDPVPSTVRNLGLDNICLPSYGKNSCTYVAWERQNAERRRGLLVSFEYMLLSLKHTYTLSLGKERARRKQSAPFPVSLEMLQFSIRRTDFEPLTMAALSATDCEECLITTFFIQT